MPPPVHYRVEKLAKRFFHLVNYMQELQGGLTFFYSSMRLGIGAAGENFSDVFNEIVIFNGEFSWWIFVVLSGWISLWI